MIPTEIAESVMALSESDRLELARRIVESLAADSRMNEVVAEGARQIEEVVSGRAQGLSEDEYRRAIA